MSLKKFLAKHAHDLENIGHLLGEIVSLMPIRSQDRQRLNETVGKIGAAANNVATAAEQMVETNSGDSVPVDVVKGVVSEVLPTIIPAIADEAAKLIGGKKKTNAKPKAK